MLRILLYDTVYICTTVHLGRVQSSVFLRVKNMNKFKKRQTLEKTQFWVSESLIMFAYNANEKDYEIIQLV